MSSGPHGPIFQEMACRWPINAIFSKIDVYFKGNHCVELSTPRNINIFSLDHGVKHSNFFLFSGKIPIFSIIRLLNIAMVSMLLGSLKCKVPTNKHNG